MDYNYQFLLTNDTDDWAIIQDYIYCCQQLNQTSIAYNNFIKLIKEQKKKKKRKKRLLFSIN